MFVKQINVFLENHSGRLSDVTETLSKANIDIRAVHIADTTDYGILRLLVNKPEETLEILKSAGFTANMSSVIALAVPDEPGTLDKALSLLSTNNVSLEYLYAFVGRASSDAVIVIRVDNKDETVSIFEKNGVKVLSPEEVYGI